MPDNRGAALIVFAKEPLPGFVKTRLTPALGKSDAADLYRAFLADAAAQYGRLDCEVLYFIALEERGGRAREAMPVAAGSLRFEQRGNGLGDRMRHAFDLAFSRGYERVVIIGTDHPTLPTGHIASAFGHLANDPDVVVLGPSTDGGYYLLGLGAPRGGLFEGMRYSHERVYAQTLERIANAGLSHIALPEWADVDTPQSLINLAEELRDLPELPDFPVNTAKVVERLRLEYAWLEAGRDPSIPNESV